MRRGTALILILLATGSAMAQALRPPFDEIGIDQNLGQRLPLDLMLSDEEGSAIRLGELFSGKPIILALAYARCPMLCGLVREGMAKSVRPLGLTPGRDFTMVTVSIDPKETSESNAASRKAALSELGEGAGAGGWRFLTGSLPAIESLTRAAGFRYVFDPESDQYAHVSAIMVVTPDGRLSRYMMGIDYAPRDLRLALVEASQGKIGTLADKLALFCLQYDPATGHYGATVIGVMRLGGVVTVFLIAVFMIRALLRDRREAMAGAGSVSR